jgi:shikimate kinase
MKNIVLVGFMGTGKTVTGKILAEKTGMRLVDMDALIQEREARSISDIFATDGEPAFRAMERTMTQELSKEQNLVISTGGGIVLNPDNIADFSESGLVVCLTASVDTIFDRLEHDTTRPLLSGDKKDQIRALLETRRPLYDAIPRQIDGDRFNPEERASEILKLYDLET